jgi:DNA-binding GntR family transcriptional regulator
VKLEKVDVQSPSSSGIHRDSLGSLKLRGATTRTVSASDDAFIAVRDGILRGDLAPGSPVTETEVATMLGISRTPVREALRELEAQGLLVRRHRRLLVATLSSNEASDVHAIRVSLELLALRQVMERNAGEDILADLERTVSEVRYANRTHETARALASARAFHEAIYRATGNEMLIRFLIQVYNRVDQFRFYSTSQRSTSRLRQTVEEHNLIIKAIREGNTEEALATMDSHLGASHNFDATPGEVNFPETD